MVIHGILKALINKRNPLTFPTPGSHPEGFWCSCKGLAVIIQFLSVQIFIYKMVIRYYHVEIDITDGEEEKKSLSLKPAMLFPNLLLAIFYSPHIHVLFDCSCFFFSFLLNIQILI